MTFHFHEKKGCAFFGLNAWKSEREGGPNNQEVVGVVSSLPGRSEGDVLIYAAQLGTFGTYNMPAIFNQEDGTLNYWALTPNTGGPLYDYFNMDATQEFFDPTYLTETLDGIKPVQGIDLRNGDKNYEFTPAFEDNDSN